MILGTYGFYRRILGAHTKQEELPENSEQAALYVIEHYVRVDDAKIILQHRYGLDECDVWTDEMAAWAIGVDTTRVKTIINTGVDNIRKNWSAMFILKNGLRAYEDRQAEICKLATEARTGDRFVGLLTLFQFLTINEVGLPASYRRSICRGLCNTYYNEEITALQYITLTEDKLKRIRNIGEKSLVEVMKHQQKLLDTYTTMDLKDFQQEFFRKA